MRLFPFIAAVLLATKVIDYGLTAYDIWQSTETIANPCSTPEEILFATLNLALAVVFEAIEPDDFLPIGVPADDAARRLVMREARRAFDDEGVEGMVRVIREKLGDDADNVLREMGLEQYIDDAANKVDDVIDDVSYYLNKLSSGGTYIPVQNGKISAGTMIDLHAATNYQDEFVLMMLNDEMVIYRGNGLNFGLPSGTTEVLAHTHPPGRYVPSGHDFETLNQLGQESSLILSTNVDGELQIIQYTRSGDVNQIPPPLDLFN